MIKAGAFGGTVDARVLRDFEEHKNKQFKNAIGGLFPSKLIPVMLSLSGDRSGEKSERDFKRRETRLCGQDQAL